MIATKTNRQSRRCQVVVPSEADELSVLPQRAVLTTQSPSRASLVPTGYAIIAGARLAREEARGLNTKNLHELRPDDSAKENINERHPRRTATCSRSLHALHRPLRPGHRHALARNRRP